MSLSRTHRNGTCGWAIGLVVALIVPAATAQIGRGTPPEKKPPATQPAEKKAAPETPQKPITGETKPAAGKKAEPGASDKGTTTQEARRRALEKIREMQKQAKSKPAADQAEQERVERIQQLKREREKRIEEARRRSEELRKQREAERAARAEAARAEARAREEAGKSEPGMPAAQPRGAENPVVEPNAPEESQPDQPEAQPTDQPERMSEQPIPGDNTTPRGRRRAEGATPRVGRRGRRHPGAQGAPQARERVTHPARESAADVDVSSQTPVEPPPLPPDGKTEWFNFVDMPWEDVIKQYAERIGKPLMNVDDIVVGGELTYESKERFTKEEALDELNFLLVQQGYFMAETDRYVYVMPLNELGKVLDPKKAFYPSIEAFNAANLRDMEFAQVNIQISDRPASEIRDMLAPAMPDRALPIVLGDTNQIQITGLARDVRRFMDLYQTYKLQEYDPRQTRFIDIQTNVRDIEQMVRDYLDIKPPQRQYNRQTRQWETIGSESNIKIIPDERTKTLIVRATPEKLDEIQDFIKRVDVKPDWEFGTHVIAVEHGDAVDIANLLNQIFQQEQPRSARTPVRQPTRRTSSRTNSRTNTAQTNTPDPESIIVEDLYERAKKTVRIVADERTNNLIVYANKDGVDRVKEMLEQIDVEIPSNFQTFRLEYADAQEIQPIVEQFAQGISGTPTFRGGRSSRNSISIVADPSINALHVVAERQAMQKIEEMIKQLDIDTGEQRHIVRLENLTPSRVAQMVSPLLGGPGGMVSSSRRRGRTQNASATSELIPLDEAGILIVICSDEQWNKIEDTIRIWDEGALSDKPAERVFTLEHADPDRIVPVLQQLYRQYNHPILGRSSVFVDSLSDTQIIAYGVQPALDEIGALLPTLDVEPEEHPLVIIPLEYADATQVAELAQGLLPATSGRSNRRGPRGPAPGGGASITPEPVTNSLIVQADEDTLKRVKDFVSNMEETNAKQQPERQFYTLENASTREVTQAITSLVGGTTGRGRSRNAVGSQVKVAIVGNQVVVDAPAAEQAQIGALVKELDERADKGIVTKLLKLPGADVRSIAQKLTAAFRDRVRQQGVVASFLDDTVTETILMTVSSDVLADAESLLKQFEDITANLVWVIEPYQLKYASAEEAARWLREQLIAQMTPTLGRSVAQQITVTQQARTNRIFMNAPSVAVEAGKMLLDQYDQEGSQAPPPQTDVWTVALPGIDVDNLARQLRPHLDGLTRGRPDRLTAAASADQVTNSLILSAPRDLKDKVDDLIKQFSARSEDLEPEQKFVKLEHADADHVAEQLRNILLTQIERQRGRGVAQQVSIQAEPRLKSIVINAPKFALDMAESLITKLDQEGSDDLQIKTYDLKQLDAQQVAFQVQMFLRGMGGRPQPGQMQPAAFAEPTTNTLIVIAPEEHLPMIESLITGIESKQMPVSEATPFELKNVRADQIARPVETMLRAKIAEGEGARAKNIQIAVMPETESNRLIVFAPTEYLDLVGEVIKMIDKEVDNGQIVHIIPLEQGNAPDMARSVDQMVRANLPRGGQPKVTVVADAGSNSLILQGLPKDLADVETTVKQLDAAGETIPELHTFDLKYASAFDAADTLGAIFPQARNPIDNVTVTADDYYNRLLVSANRRKMRQIEAYIKELDKAPEEGETTGKEVHFVDVYRGDPMDIAYDVSDLYPPIEKGGPDIEGDLFEPFIKVVCRTGEFDGILEKIRMFDANARVKTKWKEMKLSGDAARTLAALQQMHPDLQVDYVKKEDVAPPSLVEEARPKGDLPPELQRREHKPSADQPGPGENAPKGADQPGAGQQPSGKSGKVGLRADGGVQATLASYEQPVEREPVNPIEQRVRDYLETTYALGASGQDDVTPATPQKQPVHVKVFPDGHIIMEGPETDVEDVEDTIDVIESDLGVGQVIRIFKFNYGDVTQAARILDLMFNERQQIRLPNAAQRLQQQQQQQRQQGRGRGQQSGGNGKGQEGQQGGDLATQLRQMMGQQQQANQQKPTTQLRIATDVGNNYLIIKCDESQLPDIRQLLRELDIPPGEVEVRVIQLHQIDAVETAENLKSVLGITESSSRGRQQQRATGRVNAQQQILEALAQQQVATAGGEGAKVDSVEIVPNQVTNSLLISSPPDVFEIIDRLINELETLNGYDVVVIRDYPLANAKVDDVLPLLQSIFADAASGGAGGRGGGGGKARSPANLGPVSISGDPRVNTIIYSAQQKDVPLVEEQIAKLDIQGALAEAELYTVQYGDAQSIADAVSQIFMIGGGGGGQRGGRGRGGGATDSGNELRISAEPQTNTILLFGPAEKRELIFAKIRQLDMQASTDIRQIDVKFAKPSKVADMLLSVFGGSGGSVASSGGNRGRGRGASPGGATGRVAIFGDDNAKKLLVRAPDPLFEKISDLAKTLDQPSEQLQIRKFPLQYADALTVDGALRQGLTDYIQNSMVAGGGSNVDFDPFTVLPDPRTNSLIVIGSDQTFQFVNVALAEIDVPTDEDQAPMPRVIQVPMKQDAVQLADTIGRMFNDAEQIDAQRTGRQPNLITIGSDPDTNTIIVNGSKQQYDAVSKLVDELGAVRPGEYATRVIQLTNLTADEAEDIIGRLQQQRSGSQSRGSSTFRSPGGTRSTTFRPSGSSRGRGSFRPSGGTSSGGTFRPSNSSRSRGSFRPPSSSGSNRSQSRPRSSRQSQQPSRSGQSRRRPGDRAMRWRSGADGATLDAVRSGFGRAVLTTMTLAPAFQSAALAQFVARRAAQQEAQPSDPPQRPRGRRGDRPRPPRRAQSQPAARPPTKPSGKRPAKATAKPPAQATAKPPAKAPATSVADVQPTTAPAPQAGAPFDSVSGQLQGDVYTVPLDSRRIAITGDEEDLDFIEHMLQLMEASTPEGIIRIFSLQHAKATAIQPIVEQTIQAYVDQMGGQGRADRFSIIAEARSNSLIVTASETNMDMISQVVNHLDEQAQVGPTDFESVPLHHMRASEAAQLLEQQIQKLNQMREVPTAQQASIQAVDRSNSILVVGTAADIADIKRMIEAIDFELDEKNADFGVGRIVMLDLKNAVAQDLADTLNTLIELDRTTAGQGSQSGQGSRLIRRLLFSTADGRELPPLDLDKPIEIIPEKAKNSLMLISSPDNNQALVEIASLFDKLPAAADVEVKSLPLRYAKAEGVATMLQDLFDQGRTKALARPGEGDTRPSGVMAPQPKTLTGRGLPYVVHFSSDTRTNAVIAVGRSEALQLVAALVNELDQPSVSGVMKPHLLQLQNKQATKLQDDLTNLLDKRAEALGLQDNAARDNAVMIPDERTNTLVILATDEVYGLIDEIASQLDTAASYRVVDSTFRRLEYADSVKLGNLLQELFDRKKQAEEGVTDNGQKEVLFVLSDSRTNSLMLTGTRDYLSEAEKYIAQLDQAYVPTLEFKIRPIMLNSATSIATHLQDMIDKTRNQQQGMEGTPIYVSAEPYSNTLLIAASREDMLTVERWVEVFDRPPDPGRVTEIIPMQRGDAEQIAQQAGDLFQTSGTQGTATDVTVTHDATTNSVIAIGPPAVVKDIKSFLSKLDTTEPVDNAVIRVFKLEQADAETAGNLLRSVLDLRSGTISSSGSSTGRSTSSGTSAQQEAANQIMLVWNKQNPDVGTTVQKAMRAGITVIDNVRTNELFVTAPAESMPLIESLVAAIDVPPDAAKIRIFPLRNSDASQMVDTLNELFQTGQAANTAGATAEQQRQLQLEDMAGGGRQSLSFTTDARTNSVIAAGTTGYLDLVEELIFKLDTQDIQDRETLVVHPGNNQATAIQQAIQDLNDKQQQMLSDIQQDLSVSEKMRNEVIAVASEDTNRLILNFDPRRKSELLGLIRDLDQQPEQVMIQVLIAEVSLSDSVELGVEFAAQDLQFTKAGPTDTNTFDFVGGTDIGAAGAGLGGFTFTISGADFNFLLRTLQNESRLSVLSRPQIIAMDNLMAHIEVTNDVPYVSGTQTSSTGQISTAVQRQDVGIILEVTPHINTDDNVAMHLRQEVSDLTDSTVAVAPGVTSPIFFKRVAETDVTVKNNETVVLGGLISSKDRNSEQKVPIVGDIPVLGALFRNTQVGSDHTELLVILTPRVIRTVEGYRDLSAKERDRTGEIPDKVLTSPLMQGLRVEPAELHMKKDEGLLEPLTPEEAPEKDYGPVKTSTVKDDEPKQPSYDIPISRGAKKTAAPGGKDG